MPEALGQALQTDGLIWLFCTVLIAGLVRGFSGFGSAMIIMPVAASVLTPVQAITFLTAAEIFGPIPNLPAAWRTGRPRDVGVLLLGAVVALPVGLFFLSRIDPLAFNWILSFVVIGLLVLTASGWRYRGALTRRLTVVTGAVGGFMTGFAGIPGPPVIMLYMASTLPVAVIRANFMLYLFAIDVLLLPFLWIGGQLVPGVVLLGLCGAVPNMLGNVIGARLFDPGKERLFRTVAYIVIAASAIIGLPLWKG